jgi:purine-binding chemotaxis protein CheW
MNDYMNIYNEEEPEIDLQYMKFLTFEIDKRTFALPIKDVLEIIEIQEAMPVPEFPDYVKGIINTKGRVIPVIDVRLRFQLDEAEYTERTCIIVASICSVEIGFIVDTVRAVVELEEDMIAPPPVITTDKVTRYITGVAKYKGDLIIILDAKKLLDEKGLDLVTGA